MENSVVPSPDESKTVKHTYAGRTKRKRNALNQAGDQVEDSESDSNEIERVEGDSASVASIKTNKSGSGMRPPTSKSRPKKVDIPLPGPSPKRVRRDSEESVRDSGKKLDKATRLTHSRASSFNSLAADAPRDTNGPLSTSSKPLSLVSSRIALYSKRPSTPDTDPEDSSSIAESIKGVTKIRRSEAERIHLLKDDATCGDMEPHRVKCTRCNKWVGLGKGQTYAIRPWETHRKRCDEKSSRATAEHEEADEGGDDDDAASVVALSISQSERSVRRSEPERQAVLEADPHAAEVKPHEVLCNHCQKWVKLSAKARFSLGNWYAHQRRCTGSLPSSRVATAERKLRLVNDSQAKEFTTRSVECAVCNQSVALEGEGDYDLSQWDEHKTHCLSPTSLSVKSPSSIPTNPSSISPKSLKSQDSPKRAVARSPLTPTSQPPPSVASTDGTVIASDTTPPSRVGEKRPRDDEGESDRPTTRPRTEHYVPVEKDAPSPWGWFLMPLKSFVRGFREGLRSSAESG